MFQRLIQEKRDRASDTRKSADIIGRIEELKSAVLQALPQGRERDVARAVVKYRRVADFLYRVSSALASVDLLSFNGSFSDLLKEFGVTDVVWDSGRTSPYYAVLIMKDGGFVGCFDYSDDEVNEFGSDWNGFRLLERSIKEAVLDAASEIAADDRPFETHTESLKEYHEQIEQAEKETQIRRPTRRIRVIE